MGTIQRHDYASAVICTTCGAAAPLDVSRVLVTDDKPFVRCARCSAMVAVPVFDVGGGEWAVFTTDDPPEAAPEADDAAPGEPEAVDDAGPPGFPHFEPREERRARARGTAQVPCRECGGDVTFEPGAIRLRWTHALVTCPSCETEVRVRRSDAFQQIDTSFVWDFSSYAEDDADASAEEPERGIRRFFKRGS